MGVVTVGVDVNVVVDVRECEVDASVLESDSIVAVDMVAEDWEVGGEVVSIMFLGLVEGLSARTVSMRS